MKIFSGIVAFFVFISFFAYGTTNKNQEQVFYLKYYDQCEKGAEWVRSYLKNIDSSVNVEVIEIISLLDFEFGKEKILKIQVSSNNMESIKLSINRFILRCGPNANFILPENIKTEEEVREYIESKLGFVYEGPIEIGFDRDGRLVVSYAKKFP